MAILIQLPERRVSRESCENDFKNRTFSSEEGMNFLNCVFEGFADFSNSKFHGPYDVDFSNAVFLEGASFENVEFGKEWQRIFGDRKITFSRDNDEGKPIFALHEFAIREGENIKKSSNDFTNSEELETLIKRKGFKELEITEISETFQMFIKNPKSVLFLGSRFGHMAIAGITTSQKKEYITKEKNRFGKLSKENLHIAKKHLEKFEESYNNDNLQSLNESTKTAIQTILCRYLNTEEIFNRTSGIGEVNFSKCRFFNQIETSFHGAIFLNGEVSFYLAGFHNQGKVNFSSVGFYNSSYINFSSNEFHNLGSIHFSFTGFYNQDYVSFSLAEFNNQDVVYFISTQFHNQDHVSFSSTKFYNHGDISFHSANFGNQGDVLTDSAQFYNQGYISFDSTKFYNTGDVSFDSSEFHNQGYILFKSSEFKNRGNIYFYSSDFKNSQSLQFHEILWLNSETLDFSNMQFNDPIDIKFVENFFLSEDNISFQGIRFSKEGSCQFQRCFFSETKQVDFTGCYFRHTTFEGGPAKWLSERFLKLEEKIKERFQKLNIVDKKDQPLFMNVFDNDVEVLWNDLTTDSAKNLTFRLTNFSGSIFDGMTLSHIELNAPKWDKNSLGRNALTKEVRLRNIFKEIRFDTDLEDLRDLEDQYTQLKNNLEQKGNYRHAGDFHYGEQEIRLEGFKLEAKIEGKIFRNFWARILTIFYKVLSGYGEQPSRAIIVFILGLLLSALLLFPFNKPIDANLTNNFEPSYFKTLVQLITPFSWKKDLQQDSFNFSWNKAFLIISQVFLLGVQLPLMVMAIRRKFKR